MRIYSWGGGRSYTVIVVSLLYLILTYQIYCVCYQYYSSVVITTYLQNTFFFSITIFYTCMFTILYVFFLLIKDISTCFITHKDSFLCFLLSCTPLPYTLFQQDSFSSLYLCYDGEKNV